MPHLVHCTERKGATCYKCPFKARNTTNHLLSLKVLQNSGPESITSKRTEPQRWRLNYIFWECSCALPLPLSPATNISAHTVCVCVCVCQTGGCLQGNRGERDAHYGATSKTAEEHFRRGRKEQSFWGCRTHHYGVIFKGTIQDIMTN